MIDLSSYPPELTALLAIYNQEIIGIMDRERWEQEARKTIARNALAACLLSGKDINLAPILKQSFDQLAGIGVRVICEKTYDQEDRIMLVGLRAFQAIGAEMKDEETYTRQLTNNVHALYSRAMSRQAFFRDTGKIIETQLNEAWLSGADEMLVLPEDMTDADRQFIRDIIAKERTFLDGFADDIQNAAGDGTGWQQFQPRISIWVNRINDVENQARLYFGKKQRMIWQYGPTEHCQTCADLNGIVAFAEEWDEAGVRPQSPPNKRLECRGYQCQCTLTPTSQKRTRSAFEKIKRIARG